VREGQNGQEEDELEDYIDAMVSEAENQASSARNLEIKQLMSSRDHLQATLNSLTI
jgi:hypothetical protein